MVWCPTSIKNAESHFIQNVNQAVMHKLNKVVKLSNEANVVVLVLYYVEIDDLLLLKSNVEKFIGEDYNFGLDMVHNILPGASQFILCIRNKVRISALVLFNAQILIGYGMKIKVVPKKCNKSKATLIRGIPLFL